MADVGSADSQGWQKVISRNESYNLNRQIEEKSPFYPNAQNQGRQFYSGSSDYTGPFAVSIFDDAKVDIATGDFIMGSGTMEVDAQSELECDVSQAGTLYVYFYAYSKVYVDGERTTFVFETSFTKPEREIRTVDGGDRWIYPVECARITVADSVLGEIQQIQYGNHFCAGVVS